MKLLRDDFNAIHPLKLMFWFVVAIFIVTPMYMAAWNVSFIEGVPVTVQGKVQVHELRYNKFWKYDWTFVEIQTFSGDTRYYNFLDHIDLEFGVAYRIRFTRHSLFGHHIEMYNEILKIERLEEEG